MIEIMKKSQSKPRELKVTQVHPNIKIRLRPFKISSLKSPKTKRLKWMISIAISVANMTPDLRNKTSSICTLSTLVPFLPSVWNANKSLKSATWPITCSVSVKTASTTKSVHAARRQFTKKYLRLMLRKNNVWLQKILGLQIVVLCVIWTSGQGQMAGLSIWPNKVVKITQENELDWINLQVFNEFRQ